MTLVLIIDCLEKDDEGPNGNCYRVTEKLHSGPLSARPFPRVLREWFSCQFTETWSITDFFSYMSQAGIQRSTTTTYPQDLMSCVVNLMSSIIS